MSTITPLLGSTPRYPATREYSVMVMRPGCHFENWPGDTWLSNQCIRAFTHTMFEKWFGRPPDDRQRTWHMDGFMAECRDRRGFCVQVEQINHGDPRYRRRFALSTWTQTRMESLFCEERKAS